jgi:hypothetical protein
MTNGGAARLLDADLFRELLAELAGVTMPAPFAPADPAPAVDLAPLLGTYRREGVVITVSQEPDGSPHMRYEFVDDMKDLSPPLEMGLEPVTGTVFAASGRARPSARTTCRWCSPPSASAADAAPDRAALASRHDRGCAVGRR